MLGGRQKRWQSGAPCVLEFTDCDDGMELELHQVHMHGTQRVFSFTALGNVMRASEIATNIDDEATSCIGIQPWLGGFIAIQATSYGG